MEHSKNLRRDTLRRVRKPLFGKLLWGRLLWGVASMYVLTTLSACSPAYVFRAAIEQGKILASRQDIQELIADESTPLDEKEKLRLVLEARAYGMELGLDPGRAFTQYARIDSDALAWVVSASPKDKFELYTWWFPIVGSVPYKGFFEKPDAVEEARRLEKEEYETWVRGTETFSTLGWFDDPVFSTTLSRGPSHIVNTVLHESLHSTMWVTDRVDFNESLANFVGFRASIDFFRKRVAGCGNLNSIVGAEPVDLCLAREQAALDNAERALARELAISKGLSRVYEELSALYKSDVSRAEKIGKREQVFLTHIAPLREQYPELNILQGVNNAEILQLNLYLARLDSFQRHFDAVSQNWETFLTDMIAIRDAVAEKPSQDPFALLKG